MSAIELDLRETQHFRLRKLNLHEDYVARKLGKTVDEVRVYFRGEQSPISEQQIEQLLKSLESK